MPSMTFAFVYTIVPFGDGTALLTTSGAGLFTVSSPTALLAFGDSINFDVGGPTLNGMYQGRTNDIFADIIAINNDTSDLYLLSNTPHSLFSLVNISQDDTTLCYLRGTRILTEHGERPIEEIAAGDLVATRFGGLQPVRWVGRQTWQPEYRFFDVAPVLIRAGALGPHLPRRDLRVSHDHAMLVDGVLVNARALVNGASILRDLATGDLDFYQLDLGVHDCVLAEGAWSETYADFPGGRALFHNARDFETRFPDTQVPAAPRYCAPRPHAGPALEQALRPLVARVAAWLRPGALDGAIDQVTPEGEVHGWAVDTAHPELPQLLEVELDGRVLGTVLACEERHDLRLARISPGRSGFVFRAPRGLTRDQAARLRVRRCADGSELRHAAPAANANDTARERQVG